MPEKSMLLKGVFSIIYSHLIGKSTDSIAPLQELFYESLNQVPPRPRYGGNAEVRIGGKSKENA